MDSENWDRNWHGKQGQWKKCQRTIFWGEKLTWTMSPSKCLTNSVSEIRGVQKDTGLWGPGGLHRIFLGTKIRASEECNDTNHRTWENATSARFHHTQCTKVSQRQQHSTTHAASSNKELGLHGLEIWLTVYQPNRPEHISTNRKAEQNERSTWQQRDNKTSSPYVGRTFYENHVLFLWNWHNHMQKSRNLQYKNCAIIRKGQEEPQNQLWYLRINSIISFYK